MKKLLFSVSILLISFSLQAQLAAGPMLGNNTMKEVTIWVQSTSPAKLQLQYWPKQRPEEKEFSQAVMTTPSNGLTAHLVANKLEEGTTYQYWIWENDSKIGWEDPLEFTTQKLWQYREEPPDFSFALGSCLYTNHPTDDRPGKPYGDTSDEIFSHIYNSDPDFMLWLGDNIYLRTPDFDSKSGIYGRYDHYKQQPALQPLWQSFHHYAIWDDHDFGPNNSDRSYIFKDLTRKAFTDYWANPSYGRNEEGIYTEFRWSDCSFFLLDNRYFRTPNGLDENPSTILGEEQLQWLKDRLLKSRATFKFVALGGQFLNPSPVYENFANYREERREIIDFIEDHEIRNVVFLTGDRHRTELSQLELNNGIRIYDMTCSPMSSSTYPERAPENNTLRVEGTHLAKHNFGVARVKGEREERTLILEAYEKDGSKAWEIVIPAQQPE